MRFVTIALLVLAGVTARANDWGVGVPYLYDGAGNIRQIGSDSHVYDAAGRLVQSDTNGVRRNYTYDAYGNRKTCTQPDTDCQSGMIIEAAANRISGASYDAAGNLIAFEGHTYSYDAFNMQTRDVMGPALIREYIYTADDERIAVYTPTNGTWRWTLRDASGKVLRELASSNPAGGGTLGTASWNWIKDYVYRDGLLLASRQLDPGTAAVTTYRYHLDHLGTPRRITDSTNHIVGQHNYHAFGPEPSGINEPSPTPLKYTGHERDGDLDSMHARYYDPDMGRFLSVDPVLDMKKAMLNPQGWNRYSYVMNNPMNKIDPDGRNDQFMYGIMYADNPGAMEAELGVRAVTTKVAVAAAATFLLRRAIPALWSWALANPQGARQAADALLSPPGSSALPVNVGSGARPIAGAVNVDSLSPGFAGSMRQIQVAADGLSAFKNGSVGNVTGMNLPSVMLGQGGSRFAADLGRTMQSGSTLKITTQTPGVLTSFAKHLEKQFKDIVIKDGVLTATHR